MRVTGNSYTDALVNQLNLLAARQYRLQNRAASGQRIQAPEDDPAGMARALNLQAEQSTVSQHLQNIAALQTRATAVYNVLEQLKTISDRVGEITTLAGDGTKSPADLQAYGTEVSQLIQRAVQVANSKQGNQYLFGGTDSSQPPFTLTLDGDNHVTNVAYGGNTTVATSEIAENTTLAVDVPGDNSSGTGPRGLFADTRYGADLFNHLISLQNHLLAADSNAVVTVDQPACLSDEDNLMYHVATNGAVHAMLEGEAALSESRQSYLRQSLVDVAGADLTETLTQLGRTQNAYQAALQSSTNFLQLQQYLLSRLG